MGYHLAWRNPHEIAQGLGLRAQSLLQAASKLPSLASFTQATLPYDFSRTSWGRAPSSMLVSSSGSALPPCAA